MLNPIAILILEHKMIQKGLALLGRLGQKESPESTSDLEELIGFFQLYADRRHHGKEEDLLFKALLKKTLPKELRKILQELIDEHKTARNLINTLKTLKQVPLLEKQACIQKITALYTEHIEKENNRFFVPSFQFFSEEEKTALLNQFQNFDQNLKNPKNYEKIFSEIETRTP
ncbi:MAG: hemerythrin domain-containing protein [Parachlamydiales bacterium]